MEQQNKVQYSAVQVSAGQYSAVRCSAVRCSAVQCPTRWPDHLNSVESRNDVWVLAYWPTERRGVMNFVGMVVQEGILKSKNNNRIKGLYPSFVVLPIWLLQFTGRKLHEPFMNFQRKQGLYFLS